MIKVQGLGRRRDGMSHADAIRRRGSADFADGETITMFAEERPFIA